MYVIRPLSITDATFVSSNVPEDDHAEWSAATSYAVGARVIRAATHRIYECLVAGVNAGLPESTPTRWLSVGATNRWRMLDSEVGSRTTSAGSIDITLRPGYATAIALLDVDAQSLTVTVRSAAGATKYSSTRSLDTSVVLSWRDYFLTDPIPRSEIVFSGLTIESTDTVRILLTGTTTACGAIAIGPATDLGEVEYGVTLGIIDYSRKTTDDFGVVTIVQRKFAKRLTCRLSFNRTLMSRVFTTLAALRATPCVYVTTEQADYESLTIYGFFRDFRIEVPYPTHCYCSIEIEGLI